MATGSETPSPFAGFDRLPKGEYLQYGGQAIIEGVMMRSPRHFAVACRAPDGRIVLQAEPLAKTWIGRQKWLKLPFLRGTLALLDAMALGIRALSFSAKVQTSPEYGGSADPKRDGAATGEPEAAAEVEGAPDPAPEAAAASEARDGEPSERSAEGSGIVRPQALGGGSLMKIAVAGAMVAGLAIGVGLFLVLPIWLSQAFTFAGIQNVAALNLVEGFLKAGIFLGYIWAIGRAKDIREVFKYHGAEHKAINALEAGEKLTLEQARAQTRLHPRCGTSFAIVVLILSILAFTFLPRDYGLDTLAANLTLRKALQLLTLPMIAGVSYEAIRFAGRFRNKAWVRAAFMPGLMTQFLTTVEPEDDKIEVALVALRSVLEQEDAEAGKGKPAKAAVSA